MGVGAGPKSVLTNLVFAFDAGSNIRGYTKYGTAGTNNSNRSALNLIGKGTIDLSGTSNIVTSLASPANQYTMYAITYPEGSYSPANRHGITPGFNNTSASKTYTHSRDLGYFVFDDDSNSWVADSYFNGERINGHVYDTYDGLSSDGVSSEHTKFQNDHAAIHATFPNATHIVIGSHAAENNDNDGNTLAILRSIGLPDSHIGVDRPEYILIGKKDRPSTQSYVRENVSSAVAHLNVLLPLDQTQGVLEFDGSDDHIPLGASSQFSLERNVTIEAIVKRDDGGWNGIFGRNDGGSFIHFQLYGETVNVYFYGPNLACVSGNVITSTTKYYHIVTTFDGTSAKIYVDGSNTTTTTTTSTASINSASNVSIGKVYSSDRLFNGKIPIVKVYNRALSADEIIRNYNMYKNRFNI